MDAAFWREIFKKLESDLTPTHEIDYVIDNFVIPHKIDPSKFSANYQVLVKGGVDIEELITFEDKTTKVTPSIRYFVQPDDREYAMPPWFHAAYPEVVLWYSERKRNLLNQPSYGENTVTIELMKLFGFTRMEEIADEKKMLNTKGQFHVHLLKNLVNSYAAITSSNSFETQIAT